MKDQKQNTKGQQQEIWNNEPKDEKNNFFFSCYSKEKNGTQIMEQFGVQIMTQKVYLWQHMEKCRNRFEGLIFRRDVEVRIYV